LSTKRNIKKKVAPTTGNKLTSFYYSQVSNNLLDTVSERIKNRQSGICFIEGDPGIGKTAILLMLKLTLPREAIRQKSADQSENVLCIPVSLFTHVMGDSIGWGMINAFEELILKRRKESNRIVNKKKTPKYIDALKLLLNSYKDTITAIVFLIDDIEKLNWSKPQLTEELKTLVDDLQLFPLPTEVVLTGRPGLIDSSVLEASRDFSKYTLTKSYQLDWMNNYIRSYFKTQHDESEWIAFQDYLITVLANSQDKGTLILSFDYEAFRNLLVHFRIDDPQLSQLWLELSWKRIVNDFKKNEYEKWLNQYGELLPYFGSNKSNDLIDLFTELIPISKCKSFKDLSLIDQDFSKQFELIGGSNDPENAIVYVIESINKFLKKKSSSNYGEARQIINTFRELLSENDNQLADDKNNFLGKLIQAFFVRELGKWEIFLSEELNDIEQETKEIENRFGEIRTLVERLKFDVSLEQNIRIAFDLISKTQPFEDGIFIKTSVSTNGDVNVEKSFLFSMRSRSVVPIESCVIDREDIKSCINESSLYELVKIELYPSLYANVKKWIKRENNDNRETLVERVLVDGELFGIIILPYIENVTEDDPLRYFDELSLSCALIELLFAYSARSLRIADMRNIMANLAHKLKNPLIALEYLLEQVKEYIVDKGLQDQIVLTEKGEQLARENRTVDISKNSFNGILKRWETIVDQLKDTSRAISLYGTIRLSRQQLTLKSVIEKAINLNRTELKPFTVKYSGAIDVQVDGDFEKLVEVFDNLVSNSLKNVSEDLSCNLDIVIIDEYDSVQIRFTDNGVGISTKNSDDIWNPFWTSDNKRGVGLGLAIVRRLIELHKGTIVLNGEYEEGAQFIISLPKGRIDGK